MSMLNETNTSNCQLFSARSCLACSGRHPAAKTNWLIITCCRTGSILPTKQKFWQRAQQLNQTSRDLLVFNNNDHVVT